MVVSCWLIVRDRTRCRQHMLGRELIGAGPGTVFRGLRVRPLELRAYSLRCCVWEHLLLIINRSLENDHSAQEECVIDRVRLGSFDVRVRVVRIAFIQKQLSNGSKTVDPSNWEGF